MGVQRLQTTSCFEFSAASCQIHLDVMSLIVLWISKFVGIDMFRHVCNLELHVETSTYVSVSPVDGLSFLRTTPTHPSFSCYGQ